MSKILVIAEHDGSVLNPGTAKTVACATEIEAAEIDVLVLEIDVGLRGVKPDQHVRMGAIEGRESRNQPANGEGRVHLERERPLFPRREDQVRPFVDEPESVMQGRVVQAPCPGQFDAPGDAVEQVHGQVILEAPDLVADG